MRTAAVYRITLLIMTTYKARRVSWQFHILYFSILTDLDMGPWRRTLSTLLNFFLLKLALAGQLVSRSRQRLVLEKKGPFSFSVFFFLFFLAKAEPLGSLLPMQHLRR